jgi:NADH:ubiquinone reductase (H+-translocating)
VASVGRIHLAGFFAWLMWLGVHVMYLIGFKNRLTTMLHWAVSFIFRGRSQRTTTRQQIVARTLMARLEAEQAQKQAQQPEAAAVEASTTAASSAGDADSRSEPVGTDSVDELSAAYGDKGADDREATSLKQAPES